MSITGMRTQFKSAITAITIIGGLAILLPVFFSGAGSSGPANPADKAQQEQAAQQGQVLVKVGTANITRGELDTVLANALGDRKMDAAQRQDMVNRAIHMLEDQAILVAAAEKQGIEVNNADIQKKMDEIVHQEAQSKGVYQLANKSQQRIYEDQIRAGIESQRTQIANSLVTQKLTDQLRSKVSLDSKDLKPEDTEVSARHILITWKGLSNAAKGVTRTKAQAKALADKLTKEAKANPSGFAALADKNTEDPGGKGKGGDLGWFTRTTMVKPFADAAFAAKPGDIVGPVESQFGYHIIKVEDHRISQARTNAEVQKFLDNEKKTVKPVIVAPDIKAAAAFEDYQAASYGKDKKAAATKRDAAIAAYQAAAKARPKDATLAAMLGHLYQDAGNSKQAIAQFQQAAAVDSTSPYVHMSLGDLYRKSGDKQKAVDEYKIAGRLAGDDMQLHLMLQMAFHDLGEKQLAATQAEWLKNAQTQGGGMPFTVPGG
jgi:parvulin-like peptidyl-prolyl isomerase